MKEIKLFIRWFDVVVSKKHKVYVLIISICCFWAWMYTNKRINVRTHKHTWTCHRRHLIPQIILDVFESAWNVESCCWIQLNVTFFWRNKMSNNGVELEFWKEQKIQNEFVLKLLSNPITKSFYHPFETHVHNYSHLMFCLIHNGYNKRLQ